MCIRDRNGIFPELRRKAAERIDRLDPEQLEADVKAGGATGRSKRSTGDGPTKSELYRQAQEAEIEGRSSMTKDELRMALADQR